MGREGRKALIVLLCLLAACKKDKPTVTPVGQPGTGAKVYVVCEGKFGSGNASLYAYEPAQDSVFGDLYQSINSGLLGDVFQSMTRIGGQYFLCINNSDRVMVLDTGSLRYAGTLSVPKPRYILSLNAGKAYVTSEYRNKLYVFDPGALQITDSVVVPCKSTEGMYLYDNSVFVCAMDTTCNYIYKIDATANRVVQQIKIAGYSPQEIVEDKEHMLWVLSGYPEIPGALTRLDPSSGDVLASYHFPASANPMKPVFNATRDTLYFIQADYSGGTTNNGIYRMGIHDATAPEQPFIAAEGYQYFYGLGIEPSTGHIYVGDPKGFVQKGSVYIFRQDGVALDTIAVGFGPGHFYFEE